MATANTHLRQLELVTLDQLQTSVTVIGAGGIGSSVILGIAKLGIPELYVWDHDTLEEHNESSQMLPVRELNGMMNYNKAKVTLAAQLVYQMVSDVNVYTYAASWTKELAFISPIVVMAVDSMEVRKEIMDAAVNDLDVKYVIDGRMGAEAGRIYTIDLADDKAIEYWYASWQSDDSLPDAPCMARATIYCSMLFGGLITSQVKKIITKKTFKRGMYFDTNYDLIIDLK